MHLFTFTPILRHIEWKLWTSIRVSISISRTLPPFRSINILINVSSTINMQTKGSIKSLPCRAQWFRAQFGPILVYTKCQMFSFKMVFMLNLMLLLENYSPMIYFVPLKQQFCMPLSMLYLARPVWNHTTQWGSKLLMGGTFFWVVHLL